ncbi:MAG TPA: orotate phosphoribosyltransferase [Defluviitaleaceae bacterium]|jgi:orotate phosphoribosyltransferase|nr:orotate phosphoribosyltransferase [Candidatus Epulonipiscium sp.]HOQ15736.1 orotate phosphoribosyltransferase [Defluviitaleaceae bacterium]HPT75325.1 orotate phosphoribosyltransferase [Defluviitaleaceae bacterium]HQD49670.1 orotate phosphoribosyltransferase [Defluviitaleaceae bacterium]
MLNKERVIEIFKETEVLLEGHFLLTSGRHSNQYMQCAKILQYPNYAEEIAKGLAEEFKDDQIDIVVGPAMGGIIIAYELARQLNCKNLFAEREDGKMTLRRGFTIPEGARVLVAEDVITTGGSVKEVIDIVKEQGGELAGVAVLVDRSNGNIDFGTKLRAALTVDVVSYEAEECPLCKEGKLPLVKPGSRKIK